MTPLTPLLATSGTYLGWRRSLRAESCPLVRHAGRAWVSAQLDRLYPLIDGYRWQVGFDGVVGIDGEKEGFVVAADCFADGDPFAMMAARHGLARDRERDMTQHTQRETPAETLRRLLLAYGYEKVARALLERLEAAQ